MIHFQKEEGDNGRPFFAKTASGVEVMRFEYIALDESDPRLNALLIAAEKRIGGIVLLTEDEYNEGLKKKQLRKPLVREEVKPKQLPYGKSGLVKRAAEDRPGGKTVIQQTPEQAAIVQDFTAFRPAVEKGVIK
jgi:hypothetical protein